MPAPSSCRARSPRRLGCSSVVASSCISAPSSRQRATAVRRAGAVALGMREQRDQAAPRRSGARCRPCRAAPAAETRPACTRLPPERERAVRRGGRAQRPVQHDLGAAVQPRVGRRGGHERRERGVVGRRNPGSARLAVRWGVRQMSVRPSSASSRSTATDRATVREPSSTPGSRCECRSITARAMPACRSAWRTRRSRPDRAPPARSSASVISASAASRSSAHRPVAGTRHDAVERLVRGRGEGATLATRRRRGRDVLDARAHAAPSGAAAVCWSSQPPGAHQRGPLQPVRHELRAPPRGPRGAARDRPRRPMRTAGARRPCPPLTAAIRLTRSPALRPALTRSSVTATCTAPRPAVPKSTSTAPARPPRKVSATCPSSARSSLRVSASVTSTPSMSTDVSAPAARRRP